MPYGYTIITIFEAELLALAIALEEIHQKCSAPMFFLRFLRVLPLRVHITPTNDSQARYTFRFIAVYQFVSTL